MGPIDRFQQQTLYNNYECDKVYQGVLQCSGESVNFSNFLKEAIELGKAKKALSEKELSQWYQGIQKDGSKQTVIDFTSCCKSLKTLPENPSLSDIVSQCGDLLFACSQLKELHDVKIEIESLVLTHVLARYSLPLIVFDTKEAVIHAQENPKAMKKFIANKIRERVFVPREALYTRYSIPSEDSATDSYKNDRNEKISVEWHELIRVENSW